MAFQIDNASVDERPWGDIDKGVIKKALKDALENRESGAAEAIREMYAVVGDVNDPSTWHDPHHTLVGKKMKVSRAGVHAAAGRLNQTSGSSDQIKSGARHLAKHYRSALKEDPPESLTDAAKEFTMPSTVEEMQEVSVRKNLGCVKFSHDGTIFKTMGFDISPAAGSDDGGEIISKSVEKGKDNSEEDDYKKISAGLKTPLSSSDAGLYKLYAAGQKVDRQNDRFKDKGLEDIMVFCLGMPIQKDHNWTVDQSVGKIYDSYLVNQGGNKRLVQKAYILKLPSTQELLQKIDKKVVDKVSVSFALDPMLYTCSACKLPIMSMECKHRPGMPDEKGNTVYANIGGVKDYFETSLVAVPAQQDARIGKADSVESEKSKQLDTIHLDKSGDSVVNENQGTQPQDNGAAASTDETMTIEQVISTLNTESIADEANKEERTCVLDSKTLTNVLAGLEKAKSASVQAPQIPEKHVEFKDIKDLIEKRDSQIESLTKTVADLAARLEETAKLQQKQTAILAKAMNKPEGDMAIAASPQAARGEHWLAGTLRQVAGVGGQE